MFYNYFMLVGTVTGVWSDSIMIDKKYDVWIENIVQKFNEGDKVAIKGHLERVGANVLLVADKIEKGVVAKVQ